MNITNFDKRFLLTKTEREFLEWYWKDMLIDCDEGLMKIEDANWAYDRQLNYLYKEHSNEH